jgi:TRAP-type C4-dicarboxylate transport system permease small subunit
MEKSIIDRIDRVLDRITRITSGVPAFAIGTLLVVWVILIAVYVVGRLFFQVKWMFVPEFTEYFMVCVVFLSVAYTLRSKGHISIDIVLRRLSKRVNAILEAITAFLSLLITCFLVERGIDWFLYAFSSHMYSMGPMHTLMWPIFLVVPIGLTMLAFELLLYFYRTVVQAVRGERAKSENLEKLGGF